MSRFTFFGIGYAIDGLERGFRMRRAGWNGKGMWIHLVPADSSSVPPREEFVEIHTAEGTRIPWTCSHADLLATDWEYV